MEETARTMFYDFELNQSGLPRVSAWEAEVKNELNRDKRTCYWQSVSDTTEEDLNSSFDANAVVKMLRDSGYVSFQEVTERPFDVKVRNPLIGFRLSLLSKNHQLLDKVYDDKAIDSLGMHCIVRYISYINTISGDIYVRRIQTNPYSEDSLNQAIEEGYKSIESSFLFDYLSDLSNDGKSTLIKGEFQSKLNRD